jgi:alpha-methylacyl-CoA racemase
LLDLIGCRDDTAFAGQMEKAAWPRLREIVARRFLTKTRDEWCALLEQTDACFAPVLSIAEASQHSQAQARRGYVTVDGVMQPAPAPRYAVSSLDPPRSPEAWTIDAPGEPWVVGTNELNAKPDGGSIERATPATRR